MVRALSRNMFKIELPLDNLWSSYYGLDFVPINYTVFFISNTFISNSRLKLTKNQAYAKQHPEAELLLFENYSHSSCENNRAYSRKQAKEQMCLNSWDYTIYHHESEDENEK